MCDMVGEQIPFTEEIQSNYFKPNRSKSKYHDDNAINSNRNIGNVLGNKKFSLNDFEGSE